MKTKTRRLRTEIRELISRIEMFGCLALWAYIGIRAFLFMVGIDL